MLDHQGFWSMAEKRTDCSMFLGSLFLLIAGAGSWSLDARFRLGGWSGWHLTGRQAAAAVLVPGMAHPILRDHWNGALATTICYSVIAALRVALALRRQPAPLWARAALTVAARLGMLLLFYTGEQGARLVYQHGVGVSVPAIRR